MCRSFLAFAPYLLAIQKERSAAGPDEPCWINGFMPALDGVALYGLIALKKPKRFLEIGSGTSTQFAHKAIVDQRLDTRIISIDPHPRAEIDRLCAQVIRSAAEDVDLSVFDQLEANDMLYVDNSHQVFMNSDATVVFLDILPRLKPGVLVHIHDVTLPYDYPEGWVRWHFAEQYLLACYLLARGNRFDIVFAGAFASSDDPLKRVMDPLFTREEFRGVETHGCAFWIQMR